MFQGWTPGDNLDDFHQRHVVAEAGSLNNEVDSFVRFLHREFSHRPYTVAEVVKGGSLGKGTAVRGAADIDLVVFVNGLTSIQDLQSKRKYLLDHLDEKVIQYDPWRRRVQPMDRSQFSLTYKLDGEEVDILPAFDILGNTGNLSQVYRSMSSFPGGKIVAAQQYSASLASLQINFVKYQSEAVKRVIRLAKKWKTEKHLSIRSYTMELITIEAAREGGWSNTQELLRKVMDKLQRCEHLTVAFDDNYRTIEFSSGWKVPYVMDPANPYMNTLYNVVSAGDTAQISKEAARAYRML